MPFTDTLSLIYLKPIALNFEPASSERIVHNYAHQESCTHIPHRNSGHDEHHIKIRFLIPDVLYDNGQFRTREEQDHARDRIREDLEDDGHGIAEEQGDENECRPEDHDRAARPCPKTDVSSHPARAVAHGDAAVERSNQVHDALGNSDPKKSCTQLRLHYFIFFGYSPLAVLRGRRDRLFQTLSGSLHGIVSSAQG